MSSPQSPESLKTTRSDPAPSLPLKLVRVRSQRRAPGAASPGRAPGSGPSALESVRTLGATLFVASMAAGWLTLASTATAPLLAAGVLLGRGSRLPAGQA